MFHSIFAVSKRKQPQKMWRYLSLSRKEWNRVHFMSSLCTSVGVQLKSKNVSNEETVAMHYSGKPVATAPLNHSEVSLSCCSSGLEKQPESCLTALRQLLKNGAQNLKKKTPTLSIFFFSLMAWRVKWGVTFVDPLGESSPAPMESKRESETGRQVNGERERERCRQCRKEINTNTKTKQAARVKRKETGKQLNLLSTSQCNFSEAINV